MFAYAAIGRLNRIVDRCGSNLRFVHCHAFQNPCVIQIGKAGIAELFLS